MTYTPAPMPQPDPWSYPSEQIRFSTPGTDAPMPTGEVMAGKARRRRGTILIAAAAAVALVLGGVAYAGVRLWFGTGAQPEEAVPATVAAFVRVDLSPGYGQRLKINNLAQKFPRQAGRDVVAATRLDIFRALDVDERAYRANVEPWFADRIGVGLWTDAGKQPYAIAVLASADDAAARRGLEALRQAARGNTFGFVVSDGFALVAKGGQDAQGAAERAATEARSATLAASAEFRRGKQWLPAQQTAIGWVDLDRVGETVRSFAESLTAPDTGRLDPSGRALPVPMPVLGPDSALDQLAGLKGQVILGAQATDDGVEIRVRGFGTGSAGPVADVKSTVDALPANSVVAAGLRLGDLTSGRPPGFLPGTGPAPPPGLDPDDLPPGMDADAPREGQKQARQAEAIGTIVNALNGAQLTFAASGFVTGTLPFSASAQLASAGNATALVNALKQIDAGLTVTSSGATVTATTSGYAAGAGTLGGQALYRDALASAPPRAAAVLYVDVQALLASTGTADANRRGLGPVKAIGMAVGTDSGDPVGLLRVIIR